MIKLEYRGVISLVEMTLKNIGSMGVDISGFEAHLKDIKDKVADEQYSIKNNDSLSKQEISDKLNSTYSAAIIKLNDFLEELDKYKIYFQTINKCLYIFNSQNESVPDEEELSNVVDELIQCLDSLKSFEGLSYSDDENLAETLYRVVFNVIKVEFNCYGKSKLLEYCKKHKIDSIYISKYILEEINTLRNNNSDDIHDIDMLLYKLNSSDDENIYLDEELVELVVIYKDKVKYLKDLYDSINELKKKLNDNNGKLERLLNKEQEYIGDKKSISSSIRNTRKNRVKSILFCSSGAIVGSALIVGAIFGIMKIARDRVYNTDTTTYSSLDGFKPIDLDKYKLRLKDKDGNKLDEKVILTVYEPWQESKSFGYKYKRKVKTVDLSSIEIEELQDYLDLDFEELGYKFDSETERTEKLVPDDLYTENIYEVTREVQDVADSHLLELSESTYNYIIYSISAALVYFMIWLFLNTTAKFPLGLITATMELTDELKSHNHNIKRDKEFLARTIEKIDGLRKQIDELILSNSVTNAEFEKLMAKPRNKKFMEQYQRNMDLMKEYLSELEKGKKLTLKK